MATRKITTNQLKRIINEVLNEGFYFPLSPEAFQKFEEVCDEILYPHGSNEPLSKDDYMDALMKMGEGCYNKMTGDHLSENKTRIRRKY